MAFVNEYIPEADYEKYDLRRICGEHNLPSRRGRMHSRDWAVDRERDVFLIQVWSHHESSFQGYAFYWKGSWLFFEMAAIDGEARPDGSYCRFLFHVKQLVVPPELAASRAEMLGDLRDAITACPGSPTFDYARRDVIVEFIEKSLS